MSKLSATGAFVQVSHSYSQAAHAFFNWFDDASSMTVDGLAAKKQAKFQTVYGPLKMATTLVDFSTRNYVRTQFGILYHELEKACAARCDALASYSFYEDPANKSGPIEHEIIRREQEDRRLLQTVAHAISSSIQHVSEYLSKRIDDRNVCEMFKRLLDKYIPVAGGNIFVRLDGMKYLATEVIIPRSLRLRWELWTVKLVQVTSHEEDYAPETTVFLREVMDEAAFYGLVALVAPEFDKEPLTSGDVPPHYPHPLDRAPVFSTATARIVHV